MITRLFIFLALAASAIGQTVNQATTLTNLLSKIPVRGGLYQIFGNTSVGDWGGVRVGIHVSDSTAVTNLHSIFQFGTNTAGGRLYITDTNGIVDAAWVKPSADGTTDDLPKLQSVANLAKLSPSRTLRLPAGRYKLNGTLDVSGVRLLADNATLIPDGTNYAWKAEGSVGTYYVPDYDLVAGTNIVVSTNLALTVAAGDLIKIISDRNFSVSGGDADRAQGELALVDRVASPIIYLTGPLNDSYATNNNARAAKVTPTWLEISHGLTVDAPDYHATNAPTPLGGYVSYALNPVIRGTYDADEAALYIFDTYGAQIEDIHVKRSNRSGGGNGYGIFFGNACTRISVRNALCEGGRQPFDTGGNASGGVVWQLRYQNCRAVQSHLTTQDAFASHASTGSIDYLNCIAEGQMPSQRGFSGHGRRIRVLDCDVIGAPYGVYAASYTDSRELLEVRNLRMISPVSTSGGAITVASVTLTNLVVDGISGNGGDYAVTIVTGATIQNWSFNNLNNDSGGGILIGDGVTVPAELAITGSRWRMTPSASIYGVNLADTDVVRFRGVGVSGNGLAGLVYFNANTTANPRLDCVGCAGIGLNGSPFLFDPTPVFNVSVTGGSFRSQVVPGALINAGPLMAASIMGTEVDSTTTAWVSGAVTNITRIGNRTPVAVLDSATSAEVYVMGLPSDGAIPFDVVATTDQANHESIFRALTSGIADVLVQGRNTNTALNTYANFGAALVLQNADSTPANFTAIRTLDGNDGSQGSGIVFRNVLHAGDRSDMVFITRNGGDVIEAGLWETNGVLRPSFGINLNGTIRTNWPTEISDISGLQSALDLRQLTNAHLTSISGLATNGILSKTAAGTVTTRHLVGGTGITVADGDGVSGNPTASLANTAVTPGSYTSANITVDAQGRLTSAANGSGGGGDGNRVSGTTGSLDGVTNFAFSVDPSTPMSIAVSGTPPSASIDFALTGAPLLINGTSQTWTTPWNLNSTTPAAPSNHENVTLQVSSTNASGYVKARTTTLTSQRAQEGEPPASNYATFSTRNSIGVMLFDQTVQENLRFRWCLPANYSVTNSTVVIKWTTTATSGDARWGAQHMVLTGDIDSDSFTTGSEGTTTTSGTSGTVMTTTLTGVSLDGAVAGDWVWTDIYRDVGDAADTIAADLELHSIEVRAE